MVRDGVPLPSSLSGMIDERIIRVDSSLVYLVAGALTDLVDRWQFEQTGTLTVDETRAALSDMLYCYLWECEMLPIGTINMWPTDAPPDKWLLCDGSEVSRATYAPLFAIIGDAYGDGDGSTTFSLPQFTDKSPMGANGSYVPQAGSLYGEGTHVLTTAEMPAHTHRERVGNGANAFVLATGGGSNSTVGSGLTTNTVAMNTGSEGGGGAHNNVHPVIGVYFIIYAGN